MIYNLTRPITVQSDCGAPNAACRCFEHTRVTFLPGLVDADYLQSRIGSHAMLSLLDAGELKTPCWSISRESRSHWQHFEIHQSMQREYILARAYWWPWSEEWPLV